MPERRTTPYCATLDKPLVRRTVAAVPRIDPETGRHYAITAPTIDPASWRSSFGLATVRRRAPEADLQRDIAIGRPEWTKILPNC